MSLQDTIKAARFTILLGKNGSGKSTLLRALDSSGAFATKYITPERGGSLKYDPGVEHSIASNERWMMESRRKNRFESFRQQSTAQFRNLEMLVLREIEQDPSKRKDTTYSFNTTIGQINKLLPQIELRRSERGFKVHGKGGEPVDEDQVSSGEAELIALAIEVLVFSRETKANKVLLLDEPDVHLHPDLQQKLIAFIQETATQFDFRVVIATHSTAITGAFTEDADLQIVPIASRSQASFKQFAYSPTCHEILPIFGAHPLSSQFNRIPVVLVEGEDDKRVIEQLVRSSNGAVLLSPCPVDSVDEMSKWEAWLNDYLPAIYDEPKGYSLRDLDDSPTPGIDDIGCVRRARLNCYSMENLLLTTECLAVHDLDSATFQSQLDAWVKERPAHPASELLKELGERFEDRRTMKVKDVRNVILALLGTNKPWEVVVGQLLAANLKNLESQSHSLGEYVGPGVKEKLLS